MSRRADQQAYAGGFRHGLKGILAITHYSAAPAVKRKQVGSVATDRRARASDMRQFGRDVRTGKRVARVR